MSIKHLTLFPAVIFLCAGLSACDTATSTETTVADTTVAESTATELTAPPTEPVTEAPTEEPTEVPTEAPTEESTDAVTEPDTEEETRLTAESLAAVLRSSPDLQARAHKVATVAAYGTATLAQGGYTDGKYHYQLFIQKDNASNEENNIVRLVKYDMEKGLMMKVSAFLPLNHANDMTYNSKLGVFVVVHNNPHRSWVSYVDPQTLAVTETIDIGMDIYCIGYNEARDEYAVGISGGQSFCRLDADFKRVDDVTFAPTPLTDGYVTQGAACDENFIYFVLYAENVITVYDWDGNFVTLIRLSVQGEPENLTVVDGIIYVVTGYKKQALVYEITQYR